MKKTQLQELEDAVKEGRQPICVACQQPMDTVAQNMPTIVYWDWFPEIKGYRKSGGEGDADKPYHEDCGAGDWDLVESGEATLELGLDY